jgi:uncharacterized RDD family membrane protein YckC
MTQGYGPEDPNQPAQGQPPSYPPPGQGAYGPPGQGAYGPPGEGQYGQPGPPGQGQYGQPAPGAYPQPPYGGEQAGYYMGHQLANWLQRVGASLIDDLIIGIPVVIGLVLAGSSARTSSGGAGLIVYLLLLVAIGLMVYNRWVLQGRTGQSWGKQALGLKLLRMDNGQPIGGGMALLRDLAHFVDGLPCGLLPIGYLWPLWDDRRQTFADKLLNTVVIAD